MRFTHPVRAFALRLANCGNTSGLSLPGPVAVHGDILPHLAPPSSHPIMAIADAFRLAWAPAAVDLPNVASQLQLYVPERLEDGISGLFLKNLGILSSVTGGLPLIFALVSFLASNNHMTDRMMDDFLRWVVGQKYTSFLKRFLEIRTPTVQAFADVLLDSAVGSKNIQVVDMLLEYGVEFDNVLLCNIARIGDADLTQRVLCKANQACFKLDIGAKLLCQCIWHGQLDLVRFLLKKGVSPDAESGHMSALETAMLRNSIEAIKILLEAGADPNRRSFGSQTTPMEYAALNGRTEAVKCLLAHGAHVPEISSRFHGLTVLEWAALNRRDIFELFKQNLPVGAGGSLLADLVDAASSGPDAFRAYIEGQPEGVTTHQLERALEASIRSDRILAAATLLQYGVDPNGPTLAIPPLTTASTVDDNERCRLFLKLLILHKADPSGQPGLLESLAERLKDQSFWDAFPAYLVDSKQRMNALVKSARNGNIAAAACLLKSGLDIDTPVLCEKDRTMYPSVWLNPLQMAARSGREDMVLFLVGKGANINAPAHPIDGRTALQAALEGNTGDSHVRVAQLLLRLGADASAAPALLGGLTTLEAYLGQRLFEPQETEVVEEFCDKLLDAGASVSRPGGEPSWALHEVVSRGWHKALARFLRETPIIDHMWRDKVVSFTTCTPTQLACLLGDLTALRMLLDHGASVNEAPAYSRGRTALQAAALLTPRVEKMTIVHLLLSRGADINAEPSPEYGITALQGAAIAGDLKLAELLISLGADVNAWPSVKDGRTAIEGAAEHGRLDMVRLLLNAGAIGDVIRGTGLERAIELAEDNGYFAVANLLKMENLSR
ncbi:ankyrin [Canariomyces notabilis]|uniref:Ankyrin n=1 Tax=Canariomyces notabilis TaxID=2074819 RepID=A0AAN6YT67_9PEZI|nr:ankyrin [Canariomyces arenarius]